MTKAALARVIGANKVRRRPFKAGVAVAASRAPSSPQPRRYAAGLGAVAAAARQSPADQISRAVKAKQDSTAWVLPCINCAWAQSVVGYSLLQGGADG